MGTVYLRGVTWWIGFVGGDGRWHYRSAKTRERAVAEKRLADMEAATTAGNRLAELGPLSVAEWGEKWSSERTGRLWNAKHEWRSVELHALPMLVGDRQRFGKMVLAEVRPRHVLQLVRGLRQKGLAPRSVSNIYGAVHKMFADAIIEELITGTPCVLPKTERPRRVDKNPKWRATAIFTRDEAITLMSSEKLPELHRVLYAFGFLTGAREGELAARTWADYDAETEPLGRLSVYSSYTRGNKEVKSTKTEVPREVPVHPALAAVLARWKLSGWRAALGRKPTPADLIIPNSEGRMLTDLVINDWLHRDLDRLGLRLRRFHDMRRTFISLGQADGAIKPLLKWVSHGVQSQDVIDDYTTPAWETLCGQVKCLKLRVVGAATLRRIAK
jgi:integrase